MHCIKIKSKKKFFSNFFNSDKFLIEIFRSFFLPSGYVPAFNSFDLGYNLSGSISRGTKVLLNWVNE